MNRHAMETLHKYRLHLLSANQVVLQKKIAEEHDQEARLREIEDRIGHLQKAKGSAVSVADLCHFDSAGAYMQCRKTMANRALSLAKTAHQDALEKTVQTKISGDQVEIIIKHHDRDKNYQQGVFEQQRLDDIVSGKFAGSSVGTL